MIASILTFIKKHKLIKPHDTIIIGLSGGPDSVALLNVLNELKKEYSLKLIAAHLDHQWRKQSVNDMIFCKRIADKLDIPFETAQASNITLKRKYSGSKEELGRALRRCFLEALAKKYNAHSIALGHHKDDQQETFFIRLIRGSSISGLAGIQPITGYYIRPLLAVYKSQILSYLKEHELTYVHDYTNEEEDFLRNKIRLKVLPQLKQIDERFDKNFEKTLEHIQETTHFLDKLTTTIFQKVTSSEQGLIVLNKKAFLEQDTFLHHSLLLKWLCTAHVPFVPSTALFNEIVRFIKQPASGEHVFYKKWIIKKQRNQLSIKAL